MSATCSTHIEAPVEKVFDFYKDPRKAWDNLAMAGELTDVKTTKDGLGTYYSWTWKIAGPLHWTGFDVYTEFVPNKKITDRSSRPFVGTWTYTFDKEGSGTRVTATRHPAAHLTLRLGDLLTDRFRVAMQQREFAILKKLLEKPAAPAAVPAAS